MQKFSPVKEQIDLILRGAKEVIPVEELEKKRDDAINLINVQAVDKAKQIPDDSTSLQLQLADKYFQTYLNKKPPVLFAPRPRPDRSRRRRQGQSDLRRAPGFLSWRPNRGHRTPVHTA